MSRSLFQIAASSTVLTVSLAGLTAVALAQTAQVQVIHNSPDPGAAMVDVYLDGDLALDDFAFRSATPTLDLPAGVEIEIGIAPGNSTSSADVIAAFPVTLTAGEAYIVQAAGVLDASLPDNPEGVDTAFNLYIDTHLRTAGAGAEVDLLVFHGSPDAPTVDVRAQGVGPLFEALQYTDYADDYISVPPNSYLLDITPAGEAGTVVATFMADLTSLGGGAAVVFASGFLTQGASSPFGLFAALPDGTVIELPSAPAPTEETS